MLPNENRPEQSFLHRCAFSGLQAKIVLKTAQTRLHSIQTAVPFPRKSANTKHANDFKPVAFLLPYCQQNKARSDLSAQHSHPSVRTQSNALMRSRSRGHISHNIKMTRKDRKATSHINNTKCPHPDRQKQKLNLEPPTPCAVETERRKLKYHLTGVYSKTRFYAFVPLLCRGSPSVPVLTSHTQFHPHISRRFRRHTHTDDKRQESRVLLFTDTRHLLLHRCNNNSHKSKAPGTRKKHGR